ncbi:MAG UNVERIFIED_CONTAM: hypothetical protein LVR18_30580 [Planctomycetaceae bacterium]|jgi:hypothetical protein
MLRTSLNLQIPKMLLCSCLLFMGCNRTDSGSGEQKPIEKKAKEGADDPAPAPAVARPTDDSAQPEIPSGPFRFASMIDRSGIDFVQTSGDSADKPFPAANGTGCGVIDVDLDGRPDVFFANGASFRSIPGRRVHGIGSIAIRAAGNSLTSARLLELDLRAIPVASPRVMWTAMAFPICT